MRYFVYSATPAMLQSLVDEEKPSTDSPDETGRVPDARRIAFHRQILAELARAITDGARVRAYHAWSLVDNFEWADGYTQRYGLTYVDFPQPEAHGKRFRTLVWACCYRGPPGCVVDQTGPVSFEMECKQWPGLRSG